MTFLSTSLNHSTLQLLGHSSHFDCKINDNTNTIQIFLWQRRLYFSFRHQFDVLDWSENMNATRLCIVNDWRSWQNVELTKNERKQISTKLYITERTDGECDGKLAAAPGTNRMGSRGRGMDLLRVYMFFFCVFRSVVRFVMLPSVWCERHMLPLSYSNEIWSISIQN